MGHWAVGRLWDVNVFHVAGSLQKYCTHHFQLWSLGSPVVSPRGIPCTPSVPVDPELQP